MDLRRVSKQWQPPARRHIAYGPVAKAANIYEAGCVLIRRVYEDRAWLSLVASGNTATGSNLTGSDN